MQYDSYLIVIMYSFECSSIPDIHKYLSSRFTGQFQMVKMSEKYIVFFTRNISFAFLNILSHVNHKSNIRSKNVDNV
jgi:hypothetical protein